MARQSVRMLLVATLLSAACTGTAASVDSAKGTLIVQGSGEPLTLALRHAYFVTGPDDFDKSKMTRRIIFTGDDVRPTIEACENARCAMSSVSSGMWLEIDESSDMRSWAKIDTVQQSGMPNRSALALTTESAYRLAGTLTISRGSNPMTITFDAPLVKSFP